MTNDNVITLLPVWVQSITINVSVSMYSVCPSSRLPLCLLAYLKNHTFKRYQIFCVWTCDLTGSSSEENAICYTFVFVTTCFSHITGAQALYSSYHRIGCNAYRSTYFCEANSGRD